MGSLAEPRTRDDPAAETVHLIGRIPYDAIEAIDWEGDECYPFTHIYCRFRGWRGRNGPYESIEIYQRHTSPRDWFEHLDNLKWGGKRRGLLGRWRDRRRLREVEREARAKLES